MKVTSSKVIGLVAILALTVAIGGCRGGARVGKLQTESKIVELGGATSVRVDIQMGAGELDVTGGAAELLDADLTYNVADLKPEVDYQGGKLSVRTPDVTTRIRSLWDVDDYRYEWSLRLNDGVPMDMDVSLGAGRADLVLGSLSLTELDVRRGAGSVLVDLSGSTSLTRLEIGGGAGRLTVDLTGDWQGNLEATIEGGVGAKTVRLPKDVGVRVQVQLDVGGVDAQGLTKEGEYYTNDAYGQSDVTLDIEMETGVGGITLEVAD